MENSITNNKPTHTNESRTLGIIGKFLLLHNQLVRAVTHYKVVRFSINLLHRFVQSESLNQVVVTLYPEDQGYILSLKIHIVVEGETGCIPYSEYELQNSINNQKLPLILVEIVEEVRAQLFFYDGFYFVHIRDMRESSKHSWNVVVKATSQSMWQMPSRTFRSKNMVLKRHFQLECLLCIAMAEPLCLSPNSMLGELTVNRDRASKQMQSTPFRKSRRSWRESKKRKLAVSTSSRSQKKSLLGRGIPPILRASAERFKSRSGPSTSTTSFQVVVSDVLRLAKSLERPKEADDFLMIPCSGTAI